ncbi:cytochrome b/b6 domain-containing protein [Nocardia sp. NPDC046763]|uniref:cytochrome b n=1 Tax=Nocardia sp. NPDC046763 TaxID=3155256 RepID=UPI0033E0F8FB
MSGAMEPAGTTVEESDPTTPDVPEADATAPAEPIARAGHFDLTTRVLHWLMAVLVVAMLFLGAALVGSVGDYGVLLSVHRTVGIAILVLGVARLVNRLLRRAPVPAALSPAERRIAMASELSLYVLFLFQPVVGWALVSASGIPVRIGGGLHLPAIAPENAHLYAQLRTLHSWLAYLLLALFTAHMSAVLWHAIGLRDGLLRRMLLMRRS